MRTEATGIQVRNVDLAIISAKSALGATLKTPRDCMDTLVVLYARESCFSKLSRAFISMASACASLALIMASMRQQKQNKGPIHFAFKPLYDEHVPGSSRLLFIGNKLSVEHISPSLQPSRITGQHVLMSAIATMAKAIFQRGKNTQDKS